MKIKELFDKPKIISICADVNQGKSNLIYYLLNELKKEGTFKLFVYGLRSEIENSVRIHSIEELEGIKNSVIIVDEFFTLFDLDNRKIKNQIENSLRLIHHNNNILLLCGVGENFKKFISGKISVMIYKKVTFEDMINGSTVKNVILNYKGAEKGSTLLNLGIDEALIYDGKHYEKIEVPYMKKYDSKKDNVDIICSKKCANSVPKNVEKEIPEEFKKELMDKVNSYLVTNVHSKGVTKI